MAHINGCLLCAGAMLALTSTITPTIAQKAYGPGVSDTEDQNWNDDPRSAARRQPIRQERCPRLHTSR